MVTGMTAFLTADWTDGVYSDRDSDSDGAADGAPIPPFADMIHVLRSKHEARAEEAAESIGKLLAYWCLQGLPDLTPLQVSRDIVGTPSIYIPTVSFSKDMLNGFLAKYLSGFARGLVVSPLPIVVQDSILHVDSQGVQVRQAAFFNARISSQFLSRAWRPAETGAPP